MGRAKCQAEMYTCQLSREYTAKASQHRDFMLGKVAGPHKPCLDTGENPSEKSMTSP